MGACYKVACYKVSPCDFVACDFVASSLTRAACYQISTDGVLALSVERQLDFLFGVSSAFYRNSSISCCCVILCKRTLCWVCPLPSQKRSFLVSSRALILTAAQKFLVTIWPLIEILRSLVPDSTDSVPARFLSCLLYTSDAADE